MFLPSLSALFLSLYSSHLFHYIHLIIRHYKFTMDQWLLLSYTVWHRKITVNQIIGIADSL